MLIGHKFRLNGNDPTVSKLSINRHEPSIVHTSRAAAARDYDLIFLDDDIWLLPKASESQSGLLDARSMVLSAWRGQLAICGT